MKLSYSNPMVTYDEVVAAIESILEFSLNDGETDDVNLDTKYETGITTKVDTDMDSALKNALESLGKAIDTSNKVIRSNLERELRLITHSVIQMYTDYTIGEEKRKLASSELFVERLREASLPLEGTYSVKTEVEEEPVDETDFHRLIKDAIINFPDYFKEELEIAKAFEVEQTIDVSDVKKVKDEDTSLEKENEERPRETEEQPEDDVTDDEGEVSSDIEEDNSALAPMANEEHFEVDMERIELLRKAIAKAEEKGNDKLVDMLEERLDKELGAEK